MRRLSAIMFTDMVGYSKLAQENEALSLDLLDEHRKILRPIFEQYNGREIDTAGDSFFIEFQSAVEAANCAIFIQKTLFDRNKSIAAGREINLRIGLHIGDVVFMGQNVHGDGVNIAARLEPIAKPGGICISEDVARQIRNKIGYPVMKLGKSRLKNISMPMQIYCIVLPWLKQTKPTKRSFPVKKAIVAVLTFLLITTATFLFFRSEKIRDIENSFSHHRLAVLPLVNISHNTEDDYFADGLTEELISTLSQIGGLKVIARTSVMQYKDVDKNISEIGKELTVGTILEGSVRKYQNQARITVQLIDVETQEHIWSKDFDRELEDIFTVQSEIAQNIANELKVRLIDSEKEQIDKIHTNNPQAFQEYLIGKHLLNSRNSSGIQSSLEHFKNAIDHDPEFSLPYSSLAYAYTLIAAAGYGNIPKEDASQKAKVYVQRALEIDSTLAEAHAALGYIRFRIDWNWKGAEKEFKRAIELKPNYSTAHEWYALFLGVHARLDEALVEMNKAYELDPMSPSVSTGMARTYYWRGEYEKAIVQCEKTLQMEPTYAEAYLALGITYNATNQYEKSIFNLKKAVELSNRRPIILGVLGNIYGKSGNIEEANKLLAELESSPVNNDKIYASAFVKIGLGQVDEALYTLTDLLDQKYGIFIYMKVENNILPLKGHPQFDAILKKMDLE